MILLLTTYCLLGVMKPLHTAFLWHMHQPMYKDPITGVYTMPWVRLHSIKGYYDMISLLEEFPEVRVTFNIVPSLIIQINDYADGKARDVFWNKSMKPAVDLSFEEKKFLLDNFFMCNWGTMIQPHNRYWEIFKRRGMRQLTEDEISYAVKTFSTQEYLDLQVWFNLAWFGYKAVEKDKALSELMKKDKNFTEDEKRYVLESQIKILKELLPTYKRFQDNGQVELTISPLYHPILPLVHGITSRNIPSLLMEAMAQQGLTITNLFALTGISTVMSNLVSNVPAAMLLVQFLDPAVPEQWYVLALSSTFAGNLIIIGSIANLIVIEQARKFQIEISFREHARVGIPITLFSLLVLILLLYLRHSLLL